MSGTVKSGKFNLKALGDVGYAKMVERRKEVHRALMARARVPTHHADLLPEFMRSEVDMPFRSQQFYREIEINHPWDARTFKFKDRPMNLKHLEPEEQELYKHLDRERPPTPPKVGPCDSIIALIRMEPAAHIHKPQDTATINLAERVPPQPGTFVPPKRPLASHGAEAYFSYRGKYKKGKLHGMGTYSFALGGTCTGIWANNRQNGEGRATYKNGSVYEGEWKDGMWHGHGTLTYPTKAHYVGDFYKGKREGRGVLTYSSGAKYTGQWKNNRQHGRGTHANPWGSRYIGQWNDGFIKGRGQLLLNGERVVRLDWPRMSFIEAVESVRKDRERAKKRAAKRYKRLFGLADRLVMADEVQAVRDELEAQADELRREQEAERRRALIDRRTKNRKAMVEAVEAGIDPRG